MQFTWSGVKREDSLSMDIVNRENIRALEDIGWTRVEHEVNADAVFSFFHQGRAAPDRSPRTRVFYLCTTTHNSVVARYVPGYREIAETEGNLIFVLNDAMRRSFSEAGIRTRVWNHGVNLDDFQPGHRPDGPLTFGFVGQSTPFKRAHFLYQAFLNAFGPGNRDVRLLMVAGPELARELAHGSANVDFKPAVERHRAGELYRSIDCFVTFSYIEGFNMTPIEALACGLPCIVTDSPEMHEPPYDRLCTHVPASRVLRPEVLLGTDFSPRDPAEYHTPPWVHEVGMDDAVEALRAFAADPLPRRMTRLSSQYSWRGRVEEQVLPYLPDLFDRHGSDPEIRPPWSGSSLPVYRARRLRQSARWELHDEDGAYILAPRNGVRGLRCNESVVAVWQLCDGENRFVDIVHKLHSALAGAPESIVDDVGSIVATLLEHGAIEFHDTPRRG